MNVYDLCRHLHLMKTSCCMSAKFHGIKLKKELKFLSSNFFCIINVCVKSMVEEWCDIIYT